MDLSIIMIIMIESDEIKAFCVIKGESLNALQGDKRYYLADKHLNVPVLPQCKRTHTFCVVIYHGVVFLPTVN